MWMTRLLMVCFVFTTCGCVQVRGGDKLRPDVWMPGEFMLVVTDYNSLDFNLMPNTFQAIFTDNEVCWYIPTEGNAYETLSIRRQQEIQRLVSCRNDYFSKIGNSQVFGKSIPSGSAVKFDLIINEGDNIHTYTAMIYDFREVDGLFLSVYDFVKYRGRFNSEAEHR